MLIQRDFRGREYYVGSLSPTDFKLMRILMSFRSHTKRDHLNAEGLNTLLKY